MQFFYLLCDQLAQSCHVLLILVPEVADYDLSLSDCRSDGCDHGLGYADGTHYGWRDLRDRRFHTRDYRGDGEDYHCAVYRIQAVNESANVYNGQGATAYHTHYGQVHLMHHTGFDFDYNSGSADVLARLLLRLEHSQPLQPGERDPTGLEGYPAVTTCG